MARVCMMVVGCVFLLSYASGCGGSIGGSAVKETADTTKADGGRSAAEKLKSSLPDPQAGKSSRSRRSR